MKIAIIGAGISGNTCAYLLSHHHEITLFEAGSHCGGHAHTHEILVGGESVAIDTGFMVFNDRTYPNFVRLLRQLNVASQPSDMSFSVRCDKSGLEYEGSGLNGLFAQRRNLLRAKHYVLFGEILRFNRQATRMLDGRNDRLTMGEFLVQNRFSHEFTSRYLVPMAAAIWSARPSRLLDFPAHFLIRFFHNHGLLQIHDRPLWKTIVGGSQTYVRALTARFADRIRLNTPVRSVRRHETHVELQLMVGRSESFDAVVFATHADQTLAMLDDATNIESETLSAFPYQSNEVVVHRDATMLPRNRRAWASWNYRIPVDDGWPVMVTYDLTRLQRLPVSQPICASLNDGGVIPEKEVISRMTYEHPIFTSAAMKAQAAHDQINGTHRTYFCGAYWGYGFHEDGVNSALSVARCLKIDFDSCGTTMASTPGKQSSAERPVSESAN